MPPDSSRLLSGEPPTPPAPARWFTRGGSHAARSPAPEAGTAEKEPDTQPEPAVADRPTDQHESHASPAAAPTEQTGNERDARADCAGERDCREANPGQENRAPQDDSPGLLRAPLTTATTKRHLAQRGIATPQALSARGRSGKRRRWTSRTETTPEAAVRLTPHERDQLLHDDLRTEPPIDRSTSGGSIAEPCVVGLRPPAGREMACRTAPTCRAVKSSSLSRW
jgi:hypothetical protein